MKKLLFKSSILCLAGLLLAAGNGITQEQRIGTNGASELLIPVGARYIGMGGASVASVQGVDAIYYNPAGVSRSEYTADVMFSHMSHLADVNINYVGLALKFGSIGTIGLNIKALDIGDIAVTTEQSPDGTGALLNPQFIIAGLTYSRALTDRISVGGTINLVSEQLERASASTFAFDFGVQYRDLASINGLSIAVVVKNLGASLQYGGSALLGDAQLVDVDRGSTPLLIQAQSDELPSYITIGASYSMTLGEQSSLELVSTFQDNNFQDDSGQFGAEYVFNNTFFGRAGYSFAPDADSDNDIYGFTLGAGIHYDFPNIGITVDYAYRDVEFFDSSNVFTIKLGF